MENFSLLSANLDESGGVAGRLASVRSSRLDVVVRRAYALSRGLIDCRLRSSNQCATRIGLNRVAIPLEGMSASTRDCHTVCWQYDPCGRLLRHRTGMLGEAGLLEREVQRFGMAYRYAGVNTGLGVSGSVHTPGIAFTIGHL